MFDQQIFNLKKSLKKYKEAIKKANQNFDETLEEIISNNASNNYNSRNVEALLYMEYGIIADHAIIMHFLQLITNEAIANISQTTLINEIIQAADALNRNHHALVEAIIEHVEHIAPVILMQSMRSFIAHGEDVQYSVSKFADSREKYVREEVNAAKMAISRLNSHDINVNDSEYFKLHMTNLCNNFATALHEYNQDSQISSAAAASAAQSTEYTDMVNNIKRNTGNNPQMTIEGVMETLAFGHLHPNYRAGAGCSSSIHGNGRSSCSSASSADKSISAPCSSASSNRNVNTDLDLTSMNREERILEEAAREVFPRYSSSIPVTATNRCNANTTANNARPPISEEQARLDAILEAGISEIFGLPGSFVSTDHSI